METEEIKRVFEELGIESRLKRKNFLSSVLTGTNEKTRTKIENYQFSTNTKNE